MHTRAHTHAHAVYRLVRVKDICLTEIFREEKCLELAFEGRESGREQGYL